MSAATRELITWGLGTTMTALALVGLVVRFALLPYIQKHVAKPMSEVREQVANDHDSNLREDLDLKASAESLDKVEAKVDGLDARLDTQAVTLAEVKAILTLMREDGVQTWARQERTNRDLWSAVNRARNPRPPAPPN